MCSLADLKRSTAASKAWMPKLRPRRRCQAPQPRSGAPQAQGLIVVLRPQHNPPCRRSLPATAPTAANLSTDAAALVAPQLPVRNFHQLDGRDQLRSLSSSPARSTPTLRPRVRTDWVSL